MCGWSSAPGRGAVQRFAKDRTIAGERRPAGPIVNDLDQLEAARDDFLNYEPRLDAVATSVLRDTPGRPWPQPGERRRKVDDREHPARAQRAQEVGVGRRRMGQVVIDTAQENGVAAAGGQASLVGV